MIKIYSNTLFCSIVKCLKFIFFLLIIIVVFLGVYKKATSKRVNLFGYEIMMVLSGSMEPSLKTGTVIFVDTTINKKALKKGDIISFLSPENNFVITHRIIDTIVVENNVWYKTKGDTNNTEDDIHIESEYVIGKIAPFNIPYAGYVVSFVKTKLGIIIFFILPGILLILSQVLNILKKKVSQD